MRLTKELVDAFEKRHKRWDKYAMGSDCAIVNQQVIRVAPREEWLGDTASWEREKELERKDDKRVKCYVCDFIKELRKCIKK